MFLVALCSGYSCSGNTQIPAGEERINGARRHDKMQHAQQCLRLHVVRMLLWPGWSRNAKRPDGSVRQHFKIILLSNLSCVWISNDTLNENELYLGILWVIYIYFSAGCSGVLPFESGTGACSLFPASTCFCILDESALPQMGQKEGMVAKSIRLNVSSCSFKITLKIPHPHSNRHLLLFPPRRKTSKPHKQSDC